MQDDVLDVHVEVEEIFPEQLEQFDHSSPFPWAPMQGYYQGRKRSAKGEAQESDGPASATRRNLAKSCPRRR
jgi:hypothetical protein